MTNYEKYFGTPESVAKSMEKSNDFAKCWDHWADNDGARIGSLEEAFRAFLADDVKEQSLKVELKPCRCGAEAEFHVYSNGLCDVRCTECLMCTQYVKTDEYQRVIDSWNGEKSES